LAVIVGGIGGEKILPRAQDTLATPLVRSFFFVLPLSRVRDRTA